MNTEPNSLMPGPTGREKALVLIVDDNPTVRKHVSAILKQEYDYIEAADGKEAIEKLGQHQPDLILCDIMMPVMDGYAVLKHLKADVKFSHIPFVFLTARAEVEMKIEGLEEGADDYIVKPFNTLELLARVRSLLRIRSLMMKTALQEQKINSLTCQLEERYRYGNIIGKSAPMRRIYQILETIKESDSTVLITGETGTGKELIANRIHFSSTRKKGPMVSVNCGAIPRELMEREFFGHVKGAYTGAIETKRGYFSEADGGTLFLDEIGEMNKDIQVKLLRVLERGEIIRVGDSVPKKVDVRLVVATNKDLRAEVQAGNFREDLYYRIFVLPIHVPPLRERREDIPLLVEHFLKKLRSKMKHEVPVLSEKQISTFTRHDYPGNIRELENLVERFCLLGGSVESLFDAAGGNLETFGGTEKLFQAFLSEKNPLKKAVARTERDFIVYALRNCGNSYGKAARMLGVGLSSLYRKVKEHGIG